MPATDPSSEQPLDVDMIFISSDLSRRLTALQEYKGTII